MGLYLGSLLKLQWGAVTRPCVAFMRTAEIGYNNGGWPLPVTVTGSGWGLSMWCTLV